ncbi:alanine racemase [Marinicella rhabdoformis]|uniref:alanine racemase n=1 Tax=Marinicella rhabdoformis TaxID=2580566 RepID=UPI0012AED45C|nr:alanine racemase [Marinicella rhabdoformis]
MSHARERGAQATINKKHLKHNLAQFRAMHQGPMIAVVKADAYGHGIENVVPALGAVDAYAVATIDEALQLRSLSPDKRIILLEGVFNEEELALAVDNNFDIVVHQKYQLALLNQIQKNKKLKVWLKIDTGMNRLGFDMSLSKSIIEVLKHNDLIDLHLMSHFAQSDQPISTQTQQQIRCNEWIESQGLPFSFSNTGAVLNGMSQDKEWIRVGIGLFGISPMPGTMGSDYQLKPVMNLASKVIATKNISKGQAVGYGAHFVAPHDMHLGIVGIGYADGYPWSKSESMSVMLGQNPCAVVGRVSMDMLAIDLSRHQAVEPGADVQLWGDCLPVESLAEQLGVIPYALVCGITKRVKFNVIE